MLPSKGARGAAMDAASAPAPAVGPGSVGRSQPASRFVLPVLGIQQQQKSPEGAEMSFLALKVLRGVG